MLHDAVVDRLHERDVRDLVQIEPGRLLDQRDLQVSDHAVELIGLLIDALSSRCSVVVTHAVHATTQLRLAHPQATPITDRESLGGELPLVQLSRLRVLVRHRERELVLQPLVSHGSSPSEGLAADWPLELVAETDSHERDVLRNDASCGDVEGVFLALARLELRHGVTGEPVFHGAGEVA